MEILLFHSVTFYVAVQKIIFVTSNQNNPKHYMKYKLLCLFVLFSFSLSDLYADIELSSKQMRTSDGLPSNSVRCMFQDSKGFLWLGTLDGLTRYDGNTFLTYQLESGKHDQISLADNRIKHVAEDKNGFLWIKTVPELFSCYDLQKACFVDLPVPEVMERTIRNIYVL